MYVELFEGLESDPGEHLRVTFEASHDEMVMVRDIPFTSLCEHHLVPFTGPGARGLPAGQKVASRGCRSWRDWSRATPVASRSKSA
jgi:GTP cyclohydrolase I